jgi:hypothetical protein
LAFLDEEQEAAPPPQVPERPRRPEGGRRRRRQPFVVRRLLGVGLLLVFLILVVLAFRGCLQARKERGITNYVTSVGSIMTQSEETGKNFFDLLEGGGTTNGQLDYKNKILQFRGESEALLTRANDLSVPGELSDAQQAVIQSLQLRRNALDKIADNVGPALAKTETADPIETITNQMSALYASDVLYQQLARPEIEDVVQSEGISAPPLPAGNFLPPPPTGLVWLDQTKVQDALAQVTGTSTLDSGTHGMGLVQVNLGGTTLSPDTPNSVTSTNREVAVEVQNQGTVEESGVVVSVTIEGEGPVQTTIPKVAAGATATAKLQLATLPSPGTQATVNVLVEPVQGEVDSSNNEASYSVTFG